jgi:hypothetical protein
MKKIEVQMLLYTLTKKFMEVQGSMLNSFGIALFYKAMGWFDGQDIGVEPRKPKFNPLLPTYTMWNMYIRIHTLYMCVNL